MTQNERAAAVAKLTPEEREEWHKEVDRRRWENEEALFSQDLIHAARTLLLSEALTEILARRPSPEPAPLVGWRPEGGRPYFFITSTGVVGVDTWLDSMVDQQRHYFGNRFETHELADRAALRIRAMLRLDELARLHNPAGWVWDSEEGAWFIARRGVYNWCTEHVGVTPFYSREAAQLARDTMEREGLLGAILPGFNQTEESE